VEGTDSTGNSDWIDEQSVPILTMIKIKDVSWRNRDPRPGAIAPLKWMVWLWWGSRDGATEQRMPDTRTTNRRLLSAAAFLTPKIFWSSGPGEARVRSIVIRYGIEQDTKDLSLQMRTCIRQDKHDGH
jgi:hypothetical protein